VKPLVVGHWGTTPGQNFLYVHLNRVIKKYDLDMFYIAGPGHGGPALGAADLPRVVVCVDGTGQIEHDGTTYAIGGGEGLAPARGGRSVRISIYRRGHLAGACLVRMTPARRSYRRGTPTRCPTCSLRKSKDREAPHRF
jgi:hypothetical protein